MKEMVLSKLSEFGELNIDDNNQVTLFKEKPQITKGWINGGFFVIDPKFYRPCEVPKLWGENQY